MSEESKITTVEKVKNPGRVAAGKRLAAISKQAKARKAEERKKAECIKNSNLLYVSVGVLGVVGLGYGVYNFLCKQPQEQEPQPQEQEPQQQQKKITLMICK